MCMCIYRERKGETRNSGNQSDNHSDGVSESTNKRLEKTLKVMYFIDQKNHSKAHLLDRLPLPHLRSHLVEIDSLLHVVTRET